MGIQELGPRFTLKLRSLQKGTFDSKFGEYEWVHKVRSKSKISFVRNISCLNVLLFVSNLCVSHTCSFKCFSAMRWTPAEENSIFKGQTSNTGQPC